MMQPPQANRLCRRSGISLMEVSVSTLLVGILVVSALRSVTGATQTSDSTTFRTQATLLAEELLEEILQQDYSDSVAPIFGTESGEATADRSDFDDVDDYDDWSSSPPKDIEGNSVADALWERSVEVVHVAADDLAVPLSDSTDQGVKRITVSVSHDGNTVATLTAIQTTAWIRMIPIAGSANTTGQLPPTNEPPIASLTSNLTSGTGTVSVKFNAGGSSDPEDDPLEFNWDFGDGSSSEDEAPTYSFVNSEDTTQIFHVTLTVQDLHGATDSATVAVTVYPNP